MSENIQARQPGETRAKQSAMLGAQVAVLNVALGHILAIQITDRALSPPVT